MRGITTSRATVDRSRRRNQPLGQAITFLLVALLLPACPGDDSDDTPPTTQPPESEVEDAYLDYWKMLGRLSEAPDPDDPEIGERSTGQAMDDVVQALTVLRDERRVVRAGPAYTHDVLSVDITEDGAVVRDCSVDDSVILDAATGDQVGGGTTATGLIEASLVDEGGEWKVEAVETLDTWAGEQSCETD